MLPYFLVIIIVYCLFIHFINTCCLIFSFFIKIVVVPFYFGACENIFCCCFIWIFCCINSVKYLSSPSEITTECSRICFLYILFVVVVLVVFFFVCFHFGIPCKDTKILPVFHNVPGFRIKTCYKLLCFANRILNEWIHLKG